MAIVFPASPSVNDTFAEGSITYKWDGAKWIGLGITPADRLVEGSNSLEINDSNNLIWTGNNVSIGTGNTTQKLNVGGNISIQESGTIYFDASSGFSPRIANSTSINDLSIFTNNLERLTIDSSGRVLQGLTSAKFGFFNDNNAPPVFQIQGDTYYDSALSIFRDGTGASGPNFILAKGREAIVQDNDILGTISFQGHDGTTELIEGASIVTEVDGTPSANNVPSALVFKTNSGTSTSTERLRIDSSGRLLVGKQSHTGDALFVTESNHTSGGIIGEFDNAATGNFGGVRILGGVTDRECRLQSLYGSSFFTFYTEGTGAAEERLRITSDGEVQISNGNLKFSTAGTGIDFSANANAAGMTSEVLDDYEEGTWTPAFGASTTAPTCTYSPAPIGNYTKIGRLVNVSCSIQCTARTGGVGLWLITGLPFTINDTTGSGGSPSMNNINIPDGAVNIASEFKNGSTSFYAGLATRDNASWSNLNITTVPNSNCNYRVEFSYHTDS